MSNTAADSAPSQPLDLELIAPVQGGQMLARHNGQVVFVHGGITGEIVRTAPPMRKRGYLEAEAVELLRPALTRVVPPCPYFGENTRQRGALNGPNTPGPVCGGCQYQHIDYTRQLGLKTEVLRDVLRRIGKIVEAPVAAPIASPAPYAYRNKSTWLVTPDGDLAYREARSHNAVPIESCHLLTPGLHSLLQRVRAAAADIGLAGLVTGLGARILPDGGGSEQATMVLDPAPPTTVAEARALAEALMDVCPEVQSVMASAPSRPDPDQEAEPFLLAGEPRILAAFLDERLSLSPSTFFQVNLPVAEAIARHVLDRCGQLTGRQVLDVYSGAGTFTIPLARRAEAVIAIEIDPGAVADARATIERLDLDNVTLLPGDAATGARALLPGAVSCVVLDPPRSGCAPSVMRQITRIKAPRVIYISCDAATLARDLRLLLDSGYELEEVQPFDLFPQTAHIETVVTLRLPRKYQVRR